MLINLLSYININIISFTLIIKYKVSLISNIINNKV